MRILQLITRDQLRGAEVFAAQLSDALTERGHEVVLAHVEGPGGALSTRPGVRRVGLGADGGRSPLSVSAWPNLQRLVKDFKPDVVQANGSETLKYGALLRLRRPSTPVVYRNISVMSMWAGSGIKRRVVTAALRRMSHVVSVTKIGERDLVDGFGLAPDRVSVIPIGVVVPPSMSPQERAEMRQAVRAEFGLPSECPLVIHVGSFTSEKNHRELIQAFSQVLQRMPQARLLLVGDGPLRSDVEAQVAESGTTERVVFAGAVPDAARIIAAADVLVLPSLREGLPGVILEAGAAGVPAVAYDVGGVGEIVQSGITGVLVDKGDVAGLADGLGSLLADSTQGAGLGAEARTRVASLFSLDSVCGSFEALYRALATRPSR